MYDFQVDLRMPISIIRKAPFVYTGPDFRSIPLGLLSDTLFNKNKKFQRLYPFTVFRRKGESDTVDTLFCFIFLYINNYDELVVYLTPPVSLVDSFNSEALEALLLEVEKLSKFLGARFIEVEVQDEIEGDPAFPTSPSFYSYNLELVEFPKQEDFFRQHGFHQETEVYCYERELKGFKIEKEGAKNKYKGYSITPQEYKRVKEEASSFHHKSFSLTSSDRDLDFNRIPFFNDTTCVARRQTGFFTRKGSAEGYLRWFPNLFESFSERSIPFPLLFYDSLEEQVFRCGKVFEWGLNREDRELFHSLLSSAASSMKNRGLESIQFSNVGGNRSFIKEFLVDLDFKKIHKMMLLRREVS